MGHREGKKLGDIFTAELDSVLGGLSGSPLDGPLMTLSQWDPLSPGVCSVLTVIFQVE